MLFIGITGGVGAGKSEILSFLEKNYNAKVMLTDEIAHDLMEPGTDCYKKLQELFADDAVFLPEGGFDRPALAAVIFSNEAKRQALNDIVHPAVKQYVKEQVDQHRQQEDLDLLVVEAALLIEEHYDEICDELWYIYTTEDNRRARLKASRGYSDEKIQNIFESQLPEAAYRKACRVVVDNNAAPEDAFAQMRETLAGKEIVPVSK